MIQIRLIRPEEWKLLAPVFEAEGGIMPDPATSNAAVAIDDSGEICGFWALQVCFHAGPLWIRPDHRKTGLWRGLHAAVDRIFRRKAGTGYYSFSGSAKTDAMFTELGYVNLGYKVWAKEAK